MAEIRTCISCKETKDLSEFRGKKRGKKCKVCISLRIKKWHSGNRNKMTENNRRYRERKGEPAREMLCDGFKKCPRCCKVLKLDRFWDGATYCKPCASLVSREQRIKERKVGLPSRQYKKNATIANSKHREKRKAFLGMEPGAANHRLRVMVIYNLASRYGLNICFRCGKEILSAGEISLDHKIDWEGVSPELFWDVNNVAFSHRKCNLNTKTREFNARLT